MSEQTPCKHGVVGYCPGCEYERKDKPPARDYREIKKRNKRRRR